MFSGKKLVVVSGILGGLAVTFAGATTQAYAGGDSNGCRHTAQGNTICEDKSESVYRTKGGKHVIKQNKSCETVSRHHVVWPHSEFLGGGYTKVGPVVDCSNDARLPRGFKMPHIKKPRIGL
ncbi:hypothetical protein FCH28_33580 [Streptomyces piniterrae]|uniref:DUF2282 domain-containing protein n=1 Tax=Streptomyces piniterrae TaxID=2571125 RepID=A0A4U0MPR0_9ACTN|nr:hypothetical protein [Streptomyces piniterrae]TJZ42825.1 hypothetical protein FCH28_33580 [Streptomyces piniterrae]